MSCAMLVVAYVDDGLDDSDDAVDNGHETAGDGRDHGVEARCDSAHCCGVGWIDRCVIICLVEVRLA